MRFATPPTSKSHTPSTIRWRPPIIGENASGSAASWNTSDDSLSAESVCGRYSWLSKSLSIAPEPYAPEPSSSSGEMCSWNEPTPTPRTQLPSLLLDHSFEGYGPALLPIGQPEPYSCSASPAASGPTPTSLAKKTESVHVYSEFSCSETPVVAYMPLAGSPR